MRILLDELIPKKFLPYVSDLGASRVDIEGWRGLKNGRLLDAAEEAGFGVLLTCDKQLSLSAELHWEADRRSRC